MNVAVYDIIRKIHLYASLSIVVFLLMYILTSYMMIYHGWFTRENDQEVISEIKVEPAEIGENAWEKFRKNHSIEGRFVREHFTDSGELIKEYAGPGNIFRITIAKDLKKVEIRQTKKNLADRIIGFHRFRGYGGAIQYNLYALMLDVVGVSLIIFAVTGVLLWLKLLKHNKIAWAILILGFIYVSSVIGYLLYV